jgi:hypothetical protein
MPVVLSASMPISFHQRWAEAGGTMTADVSPETLQVLSVVPANGISALKKLHANCRPTAGLRETVASKGGRMVGNGRHQSPKKVSGKRQVTRFSPFVAAFGLGLPRGSTASGKD